MPNPPAGTPGAGRRVEDVLARIKGVKHNVGPEPRTYYLAEQSDLDALIAAVRAEERDKIRDENSAWLKEMYLVIPREVRTATLAEVRRVVGDVRGQQISRDTACGTILVALDAMEGK